MLIKANKYFFFSLCIHFLILFVLILSVEFSSSLPVFENSNKSDIINAVVLGDTPESKILPQKIVAQTQPKPIIETKPPVKTEIKKEVIALKKPEKKLPLSKELFAKDLLADIKKQHEKQKKIKQKEIKAQFAKTLKEEAEKSLRQQLLNEEIKLQGTQNRQAQGEVNKYKALIIQAISENWIIPIGANKKLYSELMIRLGPGGRVLEVQITKSSGDPALDSSARAAVLKASPLPVPKNSSAFEPFKRFLLKVKPENILNA